MKIDKMTIEKLDRLRTRLLLLTTIGFAIWWGMNILQDLTTSVPLKIASTLLGLFASALWIINLIKIVRLGRELKNDSRLTNALSDEFFLHNRAKAFEAGFWTLLITNGIFLALSIYFSIPALLICKVTLYTGVLSVLIASFVYNKN
jgi:hypothetical protein